MADKKTKWNENDDKVTSSLREVIFIIVMLLILAISMGLVVWQTDKLMRYDGKTSGTIQEVHLGLKWPLSLDKMTLHEDMNINILIGDTVTNLGQLKQVPSDTNQSITDCGSRSDYLCLEWENELNLTINKTKYTIPRLKSELECYNIEWQALRCSDQVMTDCINVSTAHWYGGYADKVQAWPFQRNNRSLSAYVVNDSYAGEIGGVAERYFLSSRGIGVIVDYDVPLYYSLNSPTNGLMCFTSKYGGYPYFNPTLSRPILKYSICYGKNVLDVHQKINELFFDKPSSIPDENMFRYPIWSTWAQYHKNVSQSTVLDFADDILKNNFTHAQIEIDDDWTPAYGDMNFNEKKFENASAMIEQLNDKGFRVTVWVHPFFNVDSKDYATADFNKMLIRQYDSIAPALTPWWDGHLASILDVSNASAVEWFLKRLEKLKQQYNVSSFKFDAGETSWLPHIFSAANMTFNPVDIYPIKWVELAAKADSSYHQEVRVGYRTQKFPIFVRMMDKMSNWGHINAFKTVIPCVLTYGLLGYPFVLPDMIGGNAYKDHPDAELYIRWLQMNTFLPSMQYSIVPWIYNDTIINIAKKFTKMHEEYSHILIKFAKQAVTTGEPIIRPLWWVAPDDQVALKCEDQFLVGDEYLVAPVMEKGAVSRDIYFPSGKWKDQFQNKTTIIEGPQWITYNVSLEELAFFEHVKIIPS
ncbi:hypothetical protein ACF0H5_019371 [Mactra antiquata]